MNISTSHHIDKSDKDSQGQYEFHYEYDLYEFRENGICIIARNQWGQTRLIRTRTHRVT
jgi:hypothetical protein